MTKSIITLDDDDEISFFRQKRQASVKPPFLMLGKAGKTKKGLTGMHISSVLKNLSPAATWLFWTLEELHNPVTNICDAQGVNWSNAEQQKLTRGYKELLANSLALRVKKKTYMLNPKAVVPYDYETAWLRWKDECSKKGILPE